MSIVRKVGIVIPIVTQFELAIKAIKSMQQTTYHKELFIIDQWQNKQRPLSGAWNLGIEEAKSHECDYVLVVNDDLLFAPQSLLAMIETLQDSDDALMVTACNIRHEIDKIGQPENILSYNARTPITIGENPDYAAFIVRQNFLDIHGKFDENFIPAYFEDNDSHRRINLLGYKAISTTAAPCYHYGSKTQNGNIKAVVSSRQFENNRSYYVKKWGGEPGYEIFDHPYNRYDLLPSEWILQ